LFKACDNEYHYDPGVIRDAIHFVTADQLTEAAALINNLRDEGTKQVALSELAVLAVSYDLSSAIQIANLCDAHYKPRTLEKISFMMRETDLESAKQIAESIEHFPSHIGALASIASHTHDEEAVDELISIAEINEKFGKGCDDWEVLSNIACGIADSFPDKAIGLLKDIQVNQVNAITGVALNLTDTDRAIKLIKTSLKDDGIPELSFALGAMALKLAKTDRQKAMELVEEIQDEYEKENTLLSLVVD
jgi:DNA-directed RNA polymerase subunit F